MYPGEIGYLSQYNNWLWAGQLGSDSQQGWIYLSLPLHWRQFCDSPNVLQNKYWGTCPRGFNRNGTKLTTPSSTAEVKNELLKLSAQTIGRQTTCCADPMQCSGHLHTRAHTYCNKFAGFYSQWKFITLKTQYTTVDHSSQLFLNI
jgi:hypothetical protein